MGQFAQRPHPVCLVSPPRILFVLFLCGCFCWSDFFGVNRYIAAADCVSAVPEKTSPGGEEEAAAVALEASLQNVLLIG